MSISVKLTGITGAARRELDTALWETMTQPDFEVDETPASASCEAGAVVYIPSERWCIDRAPAYELQNAPSLAFAESYRIPKYEICSVDAAAAAAVRRGGAPVAGLQTLASSGWTAPGGATRAEPAVPEPVLVSCFNCGGAGHAWQDCPAPLDRPAVAARRRQHREEAQADGGSGVQARYWEPAGPIRQLLDAGLFHPRVGLLDPGAWRAAGEPQFPEVSAGGPLSAELRAALGMTAEGTEPLPWADKAARWGPPPGWLAWPLVVSSGSSSSSPTVIKGLIPGACTCGRHDRYWRGAAGSGYASNGRVSELLASFDPEAVGAAAAAAGGGGDCVVPACLAALQNQNGTVSESINMNKNEAACAASMADDDDDEGVSSNLSSLSTSKGAGSASGAAAAEIRGPLTRASQLLLVAGAVSRALPGCSSGAASAVQRGNGKDDEGDDGGFISLSPVVAASGAVQAVEEEQSAHGLFSSPLMVRSGIRLAPLLPVCACGAVDARHGRDGVASLRCRVHQPA